MKASEKERRDVDAIELERDEILVVSSACEPTKYRYDASELESVRLAIRKSFFVVRFVDKDGKTREHAFSNAWGFRVG